MSPSGAYPSPERLRAEAREAMRSRHREVFGYDPPPEPPPIRAAMPPQPVGYVRPLLVEHVAGCLSGPERVETLGWDNGRRTGRCHDCQASRTVWLP